MVVDITQVVDMDRAEVAMIIETGVMEVVMVDIIRFVIHHLRALLLDQVR